MVEKQIGTFCNQMNVGHIRQMKLVAASDVTRMLPLSYFSYRYSFEDISISKDAKIYSCDFYRKEAKFTEKTIQSAAGNSYEYILDWTFRTSGELLDFLTENEERRWLLFFTDQNGMSYLAGHKENGLRLSFGRLIDASNFVKLQLSGNGIAPAFFINDINLMAMDVEKIDLRKYTAIDFIVYEGDTINDSLTFKDANGVTENLTGQSFKMQVRRGDGTIVTSFTMGQGLSLINANTKLLMYKNDIVPAGDYVYDLQRQYLNIPTGTIMSEYETLMKGKFIVEPQITT